MRILFDTNVLLDALLERKPGAVPAARLMAAVESGKIAGLLSATTVTTLFYLARRQIGRDVAFETIGRLLALFEVASVTRAVLEDALTLNMADFEDAVQHEAARHSSATGIVTRNVRDFGAASLPVYLPDELIHIIENGM
jgi:predicted nucleic acid-binding protein